MPKLDASSFRIRAGMAGYMTLDFTDARGRVFEVRFPAAALPRYLDELQKASQAAPVWYGDVQLDSSSLSSRQDNVRLDVARPKRFVPGPHGGFEFGTSADMSKILLTIHVPGAQGTEVVDLLLDKRTAREILANLATVISIAEAEPGGNH
jgi:hypothetical protein